MASSMLSTAAVAARSAPAQASMVAPFTGLKSVSTFPTTRKTADITTIANNGGRVSCMKVTFCLSLILISLLFDPFANTYYTFSSTTFVNGLYVPLANFIHILLLKD